jgi:pimeloyl-ACP methyl ester carboxylesterase
MNTPGICLHSRRCIGAALLLFAQQASALQVGEIKFESCLLDSAQGGLPAQCAEIRVPLYHEAPERGEITLALAWLPARAQKPLADPIVFLAGGPGQSARDTWPRLDPALSGLRRDRAVLLLDQRGTGGSTPLNCRLPEDESFEIEADVAAMREFAADCLTEQQVDPIPFTTEDAVRDLDHVRGLLGLDQLNLIGGSYGTRVGQRYAKRFPARVRTLLLDGVVPETLALGSEHGRNLDAALAAQFARCAADPICNKQFGNPLALLQSLRTQIASSSEPVEVIHPRTMERRQLPFNHSTLAGAVRLSAYAPETSALLPFSLSEALAGRPQGLIGQAWLSGDNLAESIAIGVNLSVACSEDLPLFDPAMEAAEADSLLGANMIEGLRAQCEVWPSRQPAAADRTEPLRAELPVLLLSGEFDPVTPPRYAEAVAAELPRARHLVAPGQGHIVLTRGCVPKLVNQFISEADPSALDAECLQRLQAPPYFLNYNGAQP